MCRRALLTTRALTLLRKEPGMDARGIWTIVRYWRHQAASSKCAWSKGYASAVGCSEAYTSRFYSSGNVEPSTSSSRLQVGPLKIRIMIGEIGIHERGLLVNDRRQWCHNDLLYGKKNWWIEMGIVKRRVKTRHCYHCSLVESSFI